MAEELDQKAKEAAEAEAKAKAEAEAAEAALSKEVDYKILAEAEKARADAAEALIMKNKNIYKRSDLTEERVLELIALSKENKDDSPEAKALTEAQAKVKELTAKHEEAIRALKAKDGISNDPSSTRHDPLKPEEPKLPPGSPLAGYKHLGNGLYSKKLTS